MLQHINSLDYEKLNIEMHYSKNCPGDSKLGSGPTWPCELSGFVGLQTEGPSPCLAARSKVTGIYSCSSNLTSIYLQLHLLTPSPFADAHSEQKKLRPKELIEQPLFYSQRRTRLVISFVIPFHRSIFRFDQGSSQLILGFFYQGCICLINCNSFDRRTRTSPSMY